MIYLSRTILVLICLTTMFCYFGYAQEKQTLNVGELQTFSISPEQVKTFTLKMKKGEFADIQWLAGEDLPLSFEIYDSPQKELFESVFAEEESIWFVAPKDDDFLIVCKLEKSETLIEKQKVSIQYNNKFRLPVKTKINGIRKINGFDIKIMTTPLSSNGQDSVVIFEKSGQLQKVMKSTGDGSISGFYFADDLAKAYSKQGKQGALLIKNTLDITGNGIPDVMINYYSGGAHCCEENFFIDLGDWARLVDKINTGHVGIIAKSKNPKGGLFFETGDNAFAYWGGGFAGSPFPNVVLEFKNNRMRPNFDQMKKPAPSLSSLKKKAQIVRQKLNLEAYKGTDDMLSAIYKDEFLGEPNFWGEMLDLIYSGNEDLAWQYLDLVWSPQKQGKSIFIEDFKNQLNNSLFWQMITEDNKSKK